MESYLSHKSADGAWGRGGQGLPAGPFGGVVIQQRGMQDSLCGVLLGMEPPPISVRGVSGLERGGRIPQWQPVNQTSLMSVSSVGFFKRS